jgi:hypothetical protein
MALNKRTPSDGAARIFAFTLVSCVSATSGPIQVERDPRAYTPAGSWPCQRQLKTSRAVDRPGGRWARPIARPAVQDVA